MMTAGEEEKVENVDNVAPSAPHEPHELTTPTLITFEILKIIKDAQQQHGLRHGDYQRYRGYCSRRIQRLRKVVHLQQGDRRHYKRRDVTPANLQDQRSLMIPLMLAERAWGYAMQLRQEANTEQRKKFHLVARLRKAAAHALALAELCEGKLCDPRTRLEAQAYVAWIHGSLQFELQLWKTAMDHLKKAQVVYEKLAEAVAEADSAIYRHRVEELNPSIRYCAYNIGDGGAAEDLLTLRTHGDLMANFDALLEARQQDLAGVGGVVTWLGQTLPLRPDRVRMYVLADEQLDAALTRAQHLPDKLQLLEDNLMDCKDAIASLRDLLQSDSSSKAGREASGGGALQLLLTFLTYTRLTRTMQRNLLMAEQLRTGDKKPRPQDMARFYEMILQNVQEMAALPGLETDAAVDLRQQLTAKLSLYKAIRCFYIAEYLATLKRWKESLALYSRAGHYHATRIVTAGDEPAAAEWERLRADLEHSKFYALAHSVLDGEGGEDAQAQATKLLRSRKPLAERLEDSIREEPALVSKHPGVVKLPPEMRPVPCKPLFFDLALNFAEFPPLDHKVDAAGKRHNATGLTGFVKGFLGWGANK